jgi:hypothetical protein
MFLSGNSPDNQKTPQRSLQGVRSVLRCYAVASFCSEAFINMTNYPDAKPEYKYANNYDFGNKQSGQAHNSL